jgi:peptidoglycan/xylan/chitin deacetylase (PgdA/CDA1 family)
MSDAAGAQYKLSHLAPAQAAARRIVRAASVLPVGLIGPALPRVRRGLAGLTVFVFHDITDHPSKFSKSIGTHTPVSVFRRQLGWILQNFDVVHPATVDQLREENRSAVLTFDDGNVGFRDEVVPILEELSLPAVVFVNSDVLNGEPSAAVVNHWCGITESGDRWCDSIPSTHRARVTSLQGSKRWADFWAHHGRFLTNSDLVALGDHSLICVGNHLANHWDTAGLTTAQFREEFTRGRDALARFPNTLSWYAPPHGTGSPAQANLALDLGAKRVLRGTGRLNPDPNSPILDRIDLTADITNKLRFWWRISLQTVIDGIRSRKRDSSRRQIPSEYD